MKLDFNKLILKLKNLTGRQVIFLVASFLLLLAVFLGTRSLVASWSLTALPGTSFTSGGGGAGPTPPAGGTPIVPPAQLPPAWDGAGRVTVVVIGLDYRDWAAGEGPPRSDTMIVLTLDPVSKTAGMLSIPRDLWVNIPGFGHGKINTAYSLGEAFKLPGGGPELARKTAELLLGVPIQYFAQVDFTAFERMIDEIGGIELEVPEEIKVDPLGPGNTVVLQPGKQTLDGPVALAYARARNSEGGDVDRARRQQQVILAIREKVFSFNMLPTLVAKAPALYNELSSGINTNLPLEDAIRMAVLSQQIPLDKIEKGVISFEDVTLGKSPDNLDIVKPIPDKVRNLRDEVFAGGSIAPMAQGEPLELAREENPRVTILNGTFTSGLAGRTSDYLTSLGFSVVNVGNADQNYSRSVVIDLTGKPYTLKYLASIMRMDSSGQFISRFDLSSEADVVLILGEDWVFNNPMP